LEENEEVIFIVFSGKERNFVMDRFLERNGFPEVEWNF